MMIVVFICGPFRGDSAWDIECNIRRAEELALEVWRAGAAAICPHTNTRFFQGAAPDEVWLEGYKEILARCSAVLPIGGQAWPTAQVPFFLKQTTKAHGRILDGREHNAFPWDDRAGGGYSK